jgi:hypothetical protein
MMQEKTQRMMLATWLVEIYLSKCNTLEDIVSAESATSDVESLTIERQMMEEDMRNFMTTYQASPTTRRGPSLTGSTISNPRWCMISFSATVGAIFTSSTPT